MVGEGLGITKITYLQCRLNVHLKVHVKPGPSPCRKCSVDKNIAQNQQLCGFTHPEPSSLNVEAFRISILPQK